MALFDTTAPSEQYFTPMRLADGSTRRQLAGLGYKADGSQNTWGKVTSWIPGVGVIANKMAQNEAASVNLGGVAENIGDDADNRMQKLMAQLGIAQSVVGFATGNVQQGIGGLTNTLGAGAGLAGAGSTPNYLNDGSLTRR